MTQHEYRMIRHLWIDAKEHEAAVTLGTYRYFIRLIDGTAATDTDGKVIESNSLTFVRSAMLYTGGTIQDRHNWKTSQRTAA